MQACGESTPGWEARSIFCGGGPWSTWLRSGPTESKDVEERRKPVIYRVGEGSLIRRQRLMEARSSDKGDRCSLIKYSSLKLTGNPDTGFCWGGPWLMSLRSGYTESKDVEEKRKPVIYGVGEGSLLWRQSCMEAGTSDKGECCNRN